MINSSRTSSGPLADVEKGSRCFMFGIQLVALRKALKQEGSSTRSRKAEVEDEVEQEE